MNKNKIGLLACGLLCGGLLAGCAHKDSLAGTWTGTATNPRGGTINTTLVLTEDGKDNVTSQLSGPTGNIQIAGSGTYAVSGDTLTQTFTSLTYNGQPMPQSKGPIPEPGKFKLDGDKLTLTDQRGST